MSKGADGVYRMHAVDSIDPDKILSAIHDVCLRSAITHGGLFFETPLGQKTLRFVSAPVSSEILEICETLLASKKHPALVLGKKRHSPFNLFANEQSLSADPDYDAFLETLRADGFKAIFYLPLRMLSGRLFIAAVGTKRRALTAIEARLIHSYCLDAVEKLENRSSVNFSGRDMLTQRERECLIAAARGLTEKQTAIELSISPNTVHAHLENTRRKLGARNKLSAIMLGLRLGEIMPNEIEG